MGRPRRGVATVGLLIGTLIGPWGCATNSHRIPPLSEQVRANIGTLGVTTSSIVPTFDLKAPTGGKGSGAAKGAGQAALAMASTGAGRDPWAALVVLGLTPIAAVGGAIYGAVVAPSAGKVKASETALTSAFADLKIREAIHDHVLRAAGGRVGHHVASLGEAPDADTILEVGVPSVRLASTATLEIDPPVHLVVIACPRLVRRADGLQLYPPETTTAAVVHMSAPRKFLEWGGDAARLFRDEMERAYQSLADGVVDQMLMGGHPPGRRWPFLFGDPARRLTCPRAGIERK